MTDAERFESWWRQERVKWYGEGLVPGVWGDMKWGALSKAEDEERDDGSTYLIRDTEAAWRGWQAAKQPESLESLRARFERACDACSDLHYKDGNYISATQFAWQIVKRMAEGK